MGNTGKLVIGACVGVVAASLLVAVVAWHVAVVDRMQLQTELLGARLDTMASEARARDQVERVSFDAVTNECHTNNDGIECDVTNDGSKRIATCFMGRLVSRRSGAVLETVPVCSGVLAPFQSRRVAAMWDRGFARDICSSRNGWGHQVLDWSTCRFTVASHDPPASATDASERPPLTLAPWVAVSAVAEREKARVVFVADDDE